MHPLTLNCGGRMPRSVSQLSLIWEVNVVEFHISLVLRYWLGRHHQVWVISHIQILQKTTKSLVRINLDLPIFVYSSNFIYTQKKPSSKSKYAISNYNDKTLRIKTYSPIKRNHCCSSQSLARYFGLLGRHWATTVQLQLTAGRVCPTKITNLGQGQVQDEPGDFISKSLIRLHC